MKLCTEVLTGTNNHLWQDKMAYWKGMGTARNTVLIIQILSNKSFNLKTIAGGGKIGGTP